MTINNSCVEGECIDTQTLPQNLQNEKWGFWATIIWTFVITAVRAGINLFTIQLKYGSISKEIFGRVTNDSNFIFLLFFTNLVIVVAALCGVIKLKKNSNIKEYLAINRISLNQFLFWGIVAFIFIAAGYFIPYFRGISQTVQYQFYINMYNSTTHHWIFFITLAITGPLIEELVFRGFMFSGFASSFLRPAGAIIVTALLWAGLHYFTGGLFLMFYLIIPGLAVGIARYKTNSLLTPIMMHSLVNLGEVVKIAFYAA